MFRGDRNNRDISEDLIDTMALMGKCDTVGRFFYLGKVLLHPVEVTNSEDDGNYTGIQSRFLQNSSSTPLKIGSP